jgi:cobalt/nickel transport protein
MPARHRLEILAIVSILVFSALFLSMGRGDFAGTDSVASAQISRMTGVPGEQVHPLVWQWIPPGPEVESALFALQAAIGGIFVGWVFGYWKGLREKEGKNG